MENELFANRIKIRILINIISIIAIYFPLSAQPDSLYFDTKGKDFWLTFPPNFHNGKLFMSTSYYDDSLYIFITSEVPTSGTIEYMDWQGILYSDNFSIPDPSKIYTFSIFYPEFELLGFNDNSGSLTNRNNCEVITKQYFHIKSDNDVTVYAHNQANTTSDACLVFPTDILSTNYFIMSYNSDGVSYGSNNLTENSTPSQFVILASVDSTKVQIRPKQPTRYNGMRIQNIILNRGDAYLVQADITPTNLRGDLTGSEVHSDKPIAIFAGHQRSTIPNENRGDPSRDYLLEQMPPIETWGKNALLIPYQKPSNVTPQRDDIYRILSGNDNTEIFINNVSVGILNRGEFLEGKLINAAHVRATGSILVAQFKKTSSFSGSSSDYNLGDPFEMLIPPVEQFMNKYRVINTQAYQSYFGTEVYDEQYITIVATDSSMASVVLDNRPVQLSYFKPVPTTNYYYANVRVSDGVHTISCNDKIGVYVYGYGVANSYGYVGGMSMKPYDFSPPQFATEDSCFSISGVITDTLIADSKISTISSPPGTQINVKVNINTFKRYASQVAFSAKLNNFYEDGEFELTATDSAELFSTKKFKIPGFTLSVENFRNGTILPVHDKLYRIGFEFCYPVVIENYGGHPQKINNLVLKNNFNNFRIVYNTPKILNPGENDTAYICFSSPVDTSFIDTLSIVGDCGIRKIQSFDLTFKGDTGKPKVQINVDSCNKLTNLTITDSTYFDFGLESVNIVDTVNCTVALENYFPKYGKIKVNVIDRYKDAIYHLKASDSAGFVADIIDTIQGFTIKFPDIEVNSNSFDFDSTMIGIIKCKMLQVSNFGLLPITFDRNIFLSNNILFSLPMSQLPIVIAPGKSELIKICYSPLTSATEPQLDSLFFEYNCLKLIVNLQGLANPIITDSKSKCDIPVQLFIDELNGTTFLNQNYPNPSSEYSIIVFGIEKDDFTSLKIYDIYGKLRHTVVNNEIKKGIYQVQISNENLEQGEYIYILTTGNTALFKTMIVRK